jgi:hypothetical protein
MTQVVVQHFELNGIPQASPGAAEYPIHKLAPQLTKGGFDLLADLAEDEAMGGSLVTGNQQHLGLFRQGGGTVGATIAQITKSDAPSQALDQDQRGNAIIAIARGQDNIEDPSVNVAEQMELEAKEPPFTALAKVRAFVPQQPHPSMADGQTKGNRFAVQQIQAGGLPRVGTSGGQQSSDLRQEVVHPRQPLFVGGPIGKGSWPVLRDQAIRLFERGDLKHPLQQGNRQHFGITELRLGMRGVPPVGQLRVGFQEFVHKTIEFNHLMLYARIHRSSPSGKWNQRSRFDSTLPWRIDDLALSTQDWGLIINSSLLHWFLLLTPECWLLTTL